MEHFRILLDISELNNKSYKYIWMSISTQEFKNIYDFKEAVIKKLALDRNDIKMFVRGGLLLEEEKITVLRENDTVLVQFEDLSKSVLYYSSFMDLSQSKTSDIGINTEECNDNFEEITKCTKKRKRKSEVFTTEVSADRKEIKHKRRSDTVPNDVLKETSDCNINKRSCIFISDIAENKGIHKEKSSKKKKKHEQSCSTSTSEETLIELNKDNGNVITLVEAENDIIDEVIVPENSHIEDSSCKNGDVVFESFVQGSNCKKRKRKRRRKSKILQIPFVPEETATSCKSFEDKTSSFDTYDNFSSVRKHMRFTSPTPECSQKDVELVDLETYSTNNKPEISIETSQNKTWTLPSVKNSLPTSGTSAVEKNTLATSNTALVKNTPFMCSTPAVVKNMHSPSGISGLKENTAFSKKINISPDKKKQIVFNSYSVSPKTSEKSYETSTPTSLIKKNEPKTKKNSLFSYMDYPPLSALPAVGTRIAFKLLELNESYSPEVSAYKEGIIKSVNLKTDEIEIDLTKVEIRPGRIGKFENLCDDELPPAEIVRKVTVSWSSLIEPKLIQRADRSKESLDIQDDHIPFRGENVNRTVYWSKMTSTAMPNSTSHMELEMIPESTSSVEKCNIPSRASFGRENASFYDRLPSTEQLNKLLSLIPTLNLSLGKPDDSDKRELLEKPDGNGESGLLVKPDNHVENEMIGEPDDNIESEMLSKADDSDRELIEKPDDYVESEMLVKSDGNSEIEILCNPDDNIESEVLGKLDDNDKIELLGKLDSNDKSGMLSDPDDSIEIGSFEKPDDNDERGSLGKSDDNEEIQLLIELDDNEEIQLLCELGDNDEIEFLDRPDDSAIA